MSAVIGIFMLIAALVMAPRLLPFLIGCVIWAVVLTGVGLLLAVFTGAVVGVSML